MELHVAVITNLNKKYSSISTFLNFGRGRPIIEIKLQ